MNVSSVKVDKTGLRMLQYQIEVLKRKQVKVGVLANKDSRSDNDSNATIGLKHEFGVPSESLPARSFIRAPLITRLGDRLISRGAKFWGFLFQKKGAQQALSILGHEGEHVIQQAFETEGFGRWAPWAWFTVMKRKAQKKWPGSILIDTGELRQSITSAIVKK